MDEFHAKSLNSKHGNQCLELSKTQILLYRKVLTFCKLKSASSIDSNYNISQIMSNWLAYVYDIGMKPLSSTNNHTLHRLVTRILETYSYAVFITQNTQVPNYIIVI